MKLNIQNLKDGAYTFEHKVDDVELHIENYKVFKNAINIKNELEKSDKNIFVKTHVVTQAAFSCDKCLADFSANLEEEFRILFTSDKMYADYQNYAEEMLELIRTNTREIDLNKGVRETLILALPLKVVCSEDCKGLCSGCGVNLNEELCHCVHESIDPRWKNLKKFLN